MFTQVYGHRTRRIYDIYLSDYLRNTAKKQYENFSNAIKYDDVTLITDIRKNSENSGDARIKELANRIVSRKQHSVVYETSDHAGIEEHAEAKEIFKDLQYKYNTVDFIIDDPKKEKTIHEFITPEEYQEEKGVAFFVLDEKKNSKEKMLTKESKIIHDMPKHFKVIRIYASGSEKEITSIKKYVQKFKR